MAILDRPLFQRRPTREELMAYGLPAFANGGIVYANTGGLQMQSAELKPGGKVPGKRYYNKETGKFEVYQPEPETAITDLVTDTQYEDKILRDLETPPPVLTTTETEPLPEFTPELKPIPERKQKLMEEEEDKKKKQKEIESLDELKQKYLEKSELYKELLGNPEEMMKQQGFLQLAQFGLNLASAQGANFLDKVAKSAKDPLNAFAELGRKAYEDERAVNLLALEATEEDIAAEKEAQLEKELAEIEGTEGTKFQSDLATIQGLLPNLDPLEQVKIAKGLSLGETEEDRIQNTFKIVSALPVFQANPDLALQKSIELVRKGPQVDQVAQVAQEGLTAVGTDQEGKVVYQNQEGKFVYADGSSYVEPKE